MLSFSEEHEAFMCGACQPAEQKVTQQAMGRNAPAEVNRMGLRTADPCQTTAFLF
jgi:hypothetical protein